MLLESRYKFSLAAARHRGPRSNITYLLAFYSLFQGMDPLAPAHGQSAATTTKRKRVGRACTACRRKRLRCSTTTQFPCNNCQLYGTECVYSTTDGRSRNANGAAAHPSQPSSAPSQPPVLLSPPRSVLALSASLPSAEPHADLAVDISDNVSPVNINTGVVYSSESAAENAVDNDLMQFWNPSLDLSGNIFFEGLSPLPFTAPDYTVPPLMPPGVSPAQSGTSPASLRGSREAGGKVWGVDSLARRDPQETPTAKILPGLFIRKDTLDSNFIGLNSIGATIAFCIREALQSSRGLLGAAGLDFLIQSSIHIDESGYSRSSNGQVPSIPDKESTQPAIDSYFENVHPIYPIVDEAAFRAFWDQLHQSCDQEFDYIQHSRLYLILAIGEISRNVSDRDAQEAEQISRNHYQQCWFWLQECIATPTVNTVQILLLHTIFYMHCSKGGYAWVLCGLAIRIAQSIGLHRRSPEDFDLSKIDVHLRSQLWWVAYRLDGFLSMNQGRPPCVTGSCSDTQLLPLAAGSEQSPSSDEITASHFYMWSSTLGQIQHRFCRVVSQAGSTCAMLSELSAIDASLVSWCSELPIECRPGEDIIIHNSIKHLATSLHLEYFNMLRATHWASFTCAHASKDQSASRSSPRIMASETICISAARSFVKTLNDTMADDSRCARRTPLW
ncbi:hypothetical protein ONS95_012724 [Cadophora gregata]|uniref:uncharacterized protein n=1 Tax=Cadophora gregata TaxID=51156 RepID=UPI0026DD5C29|nr:uncharacterized protein ONS95_012724 [Cadophora gregata]KAK0118439.1 hypothetical protein ONS95_012724 [Cadophora gregata]